MSKKACVISCILLALILGGAAYYQHQSEAVVQTKVKNKEATLRVIKVFDVKSVEVIAGHEFIVTLKEPAGKTWKCFLEKETLPKAKSRVISLLYSCDKIELILYIDERAKVRTASTGKRFVDLYLSGGKLDKGVSLSPWLEENQLVLE